MKFASTLIFYVASFSVILVVYYALRLALVVDMPVGNNMEIPICAFDFYQLDNSDRERLTRGEVDVQLLFEIVDLLGHQKWGWMVSIFDPILRLENAASGKYRGRYGTLQGKGFDS